MTTGSMILRMGGATVLYILATVLMWQFWRKKEHTLPLRVLTGVFFGACCVVSNHLSVDFGEMLLNVRDIGPLAAGLFFDPLSGVIAGVIGGVERFIAGELWDIGRFTRVACSLSTLLAGLVGAALKKQVYRERTPRILQAAFLGAVTEVFHMYAILITNRDSMMEAYAVVRICSVPMILFTAAGLAGCSAVIRLVRRKEKAEEKAERKGKRSLAERMKRALMAVTFAVFTLNFAISYSAQTQLAEEAAIYELENVRTFCTDLFGQGGNIRDVYEYLQERGRNVFFAYLVTEDGKVVCDNLTAWREPDDPADPEKDRRAVREQTEHAEGQSWHGPFPGEPEWRGIYSTVRLGPYLMSFGLPDETVYEERTARMYETTFSDILLFTVLYFLITELVWHMVSHPLKQVNGSLRRITAGYLDEQVNVHGTAEFDELSEDINKTVGALKGYIDAAAKKMEEELKTATVIQESMLPRNFVLPRSEVEIYALMHPAREVGGDFYDFFFVDADQLMLVIADVSGKGIPGAMFMMRSKTAIKNQTRSGNSPAEVLANVNNLLCEGNDAEMFVTVWVGLLDLNTGKMRCANAGHEYPLLMRSGGEYEVLKDRHALVLAAMEDIPIRGYEIDLHPGDRLLVYTDGVPESINRQEEQYGLDRMLQKANAMRGASQKETLTALRADLEAFTDGLEQFDDITMLGLTYRGRAEG